MNTIQKIIKSLCRIDNETIGYTAEEYVAYGDKRWREGRVQGIKEGAELLKRDLREKIKIIKQRLPDSASYSEARYALDEVNREIKNI